MDTRKLTDKMPAFVMTGLGQAQKRLTLLEGNARKVVTGTWMKLRKNPSLKKVEQTVRKSAEKVGHDAFRTVGLATQADLKQLMRQIDNLRSDVRRLAKKGDHRRPRHQKNHPPKA